MINAKRILKVTVKQVVDDSPDTSWLGEYANSPTSEYSIDRQHSLDCPVNAGTEGRLLWYTSGSGRIEFQMTMEQAQSVSHSGECDEDVAELSKVPAIAEQLAKIDPIILSAELKEYGAWDEKELADHAQNLQRILWLAGSDVAEQEGCDCGECGDMGRHEYRYFNPSFNYVDKDGKAKDMTPEDVWKYTRQDYERMEDLNRGGWCFIGIRVEADVRLTPQGPVQEISSGGLYGLESSTRPSSDSGRDYIASVEQEELSELRGQLTALGFSRRAIATAFKNLERKGV